MKRSMCAAAALLLSLSLAACGQPGQTAASAGVSAISSQADSWQGQYDLAIQYLAEGNYAEAIAAFTAAIELDPAQADAYVGRGDAYIASGETEENLTAAQADYEQALALDPANVRAYLGLADVCIRRGEYDAAAALLQGALEKTGDDQAIADKLAEMDAGSISDSSGNVRRETTYDGQGNVLHEYEFTYDARGYKTGWTSVYHDAQTGELERSYAVVEFGEDGYPCKNVYYNEDGTPKGTYDVMTFDDQGLETERFKYNSGKQVGHFVYFYNEAGQRTRYDTYDESGGLTGYWIYQYDETGNAAGETHYDAAGNVIGSAVYD